MSPFNIKLEKTRVESQLVQVEPVLNIFGSMLLTAKKDGEPGLHEWVRNTQETMSAEELFRHKLVLIGFHYAVMPTASFQTFEAYLENLESTPPSELRTRLLTAYEKMCLTDEAKSLKELSVNWEEILTSATHYVDFLRSRFGDDLVDVDLETRAYEYVIDPAALKQLITGHIRWFWKNHLEAEWNRVRPMLEESARAFNQLDLDDLTRNELVNLITGKEVAETKWGGEFLRAKELIFIPNAHIGPYIREAMVGDYFYIYFGARMPEGSDIHIPELDRTEIVSRLSALADDTRLKILQMIAEKGEMRAQEIMDAVNLSQPSVSRYLSQLTATGYLQERRESGAKIYTLNNDRVEKTLKAVQAFLLDRT